MSSLATRSDCPTDEQIAAFVDGQLTGKERLEVEGHVGSCAECAEWVAEVLALEQDEPRAPAARRPSFFDRAGTGLLAAAAAVLLTVPLVFVLRGDRAALDGDAMLAFIPQGERLERSLETGWFEHSWSGTRGGGTTRATSPAAFQLGVRAIDLAAALRAEDADDARVLIVRTKQLLDGIDGSEILLLALLGAEAELAEEPPDFSSARAVMRQFEESLGDVEPQDAVLAGKWAGAGNAALVAEAEIFFKSRHWSAGLDLLSREGNEPRLRELAETLRATPSGDLATLRAHLDRVVALLGDGDARFEVR